MNKNQKPTDPMLIPPGESESQAATATRELPPKVDETEDALLKLKDLVFKMKPEVQEELARLGVTLPAGDISEAVKGNFKWGLRCTKCNNVALYFVGTRFVDLHNGQEFDEPPAHMGIQQIPWTQRLPASEIDRIKPKCQACGELVATEGENGEKFRLKRRLVQVNHFNTSRDISFSRERLREIKKMIDAGANDSFTDANGRTVQLSDQMKKAFELTSNWLKRNKPGALEDIEQVEQAFAADGGLLGALQAEAKRR